MSGTTPVFSLNIVVNTPTRKLSRYFTRSLSTVVILPCGVYLMITSILFNSSASSRDLMSRMSFDLTGTPVWALNGAGKLARISCSSPGVNPKYPLDFVTTSISPVTTVSWDSAMLLNVLSTILLKELYEDGFRPSSLQADAYSYNNTIRQKCQYVPYFNR